MRYHTNFAFFGECNKLQSTLGALLFLFDKHRGTDTVSLTIHLMVFPFRDCTSQNRNAAGVFALNSTTISSFTAGSEEWNYMHKNCSSKLHEQINMEFGASLFYLQYAAYFAQYKVNLPGFEKFFFNAASEEREHGIKLIDYALMRGLAPINDKFNLASVSCHHPHSLS